MSKTRRSLSVSFFIILCVSLTLSGCRVNRIYGDKNPSITKDNTPKFAVLLASPAQNYTFASTDPAPTFSWILIDGFPQKVIIEIDYMNEGSCNIEGIAIGGDTYLLPEKDWETIKESAPIVDGVQKIHWRIRIDYTSDPNDGAYYTGWEHFWIKGE